jgi:hypothetical protein
MMPHIGEKILTQPGFLGAPGQEEREPKDDPGSSPPLSPQGPVADWPTMYDHPNLETPVANLVSAKENSDLWHNSRAALTIKAVPTVVQASYVGKSMIS